MLYKGENTGANDVKVDPSNPNVVYASFWEAREGPWENAAWSGTSGGIFKSTDGGASWTKLSKGLPGDGNAVVQANLAIAPSDPSRLYAAVASKGAALGFTGPTTPAQLGRRLQRTPDRPPASAAAMPPCPR